MTGDNVVLELVALGGEKSSSHAHKTVSWYLEGVLFKISHKHPHPFHMGVLPWAYYQYSIETHRL